MNEEEQKQEPAVEVGKVDEKAIEEVNKEIENKDNEKLEALKKDMDKSMVEKITSVEEQYKQQVEDLKKQLEEQQKAFQDNSKKFEDVTKQLEELKPRKGLVDTSGNPYPEVNNENNMDGGKPEVNPQIDIKEQIENIKNLGSNKIADAEASEKFLDALHGRNK